MDVYFVRHGQTYMNVADSRPSQRIFWWGYPRKLGENFNPITHPGLNTLSRRGKHQARSAGAILSEVLDKPTMVCSTEVRAKQTADIIAEACGIEDYRLQHFLREKARDYFTGTHMESDNDAFNRFKYGLDELIEKSDSPLIVVSHYHVLGMYLQRPMDNGEILHARYERGKIHVLESTKKA